MQELEKILEEIDETIERYGKNPYINEKVTDLCYGLNIAKDIIRKHMNDGWISVEESLPENNKLVLVWARSTARGADEWSLGSCDKGFWVLGSYGGSLVFPSQLEAVAWRPLPEPYKPKQPETCKYTGGSCCWPIDQCSDCPNNPERSENDQ